MIVWVLFSIYMLFIMWVFYRKDSFNKKEAGVMIGMLVFIFMLSMACNGRTYVASKLDAKYPLNKCNISKDKNNIIVSTPDSRKFVVKTEDFVTYEAPDQKSETVEVSGQTRTYTPVTPDFLYRFYYMEDPMPSTEYVVEHINVSKVKTND